MNSTPLEKLHTLFIESSGVSTDTRKISQNCLYISLKGANFNGNEFVEKAIQLGAKYALTDELERANGSTIFYVNDGLEALQKLANYHRKQFNIPVIGITGSNGKTTTKELFYAVLAKKFNTLATVGNLNNHIGVPLTLLNLTPQHQIAIIEMGANHQGEIALLSSIAEPTIGLITNIGKAHLEGFGGVEGIIKGKTELYQFIKQKGGTILCNLDNEILKEKAIGANLLSYGFKEQANCIGKITAGSPYLSLSYQYKNSGEPVKVATHLTGLYNAENILSAICMGCYFEVSSLQIQEAINGYVPDNSRSQVIKKGSTTIILDAYNANPTSMKAALDNFKTIVAATKIIILGDMYELGADSEKEHLAILQEALAITEQNSIFIGQKFGQFKAQHKGIYFDTNTTCIDYLKTIDSSNTAVLIKGSRAMKLEQLLVCFD